MGGWDVLRQMCESRHYQPTLLFYEREELASGVEESKRDCLLSGSFEHISKEEPEKDKEEEGLEEGILDCWTEPFIHDFVVVPRKQGKAESKLDYFNAKEASQSSLSSLKRINGFLGGAQVPLDLLTNDYDLNAKRSGKSIAEEFDPFYNPKRQESLDVLSRKGGVKPHPGPSRALSYKIRVRCEEEDSGWLGLDLRYTYLSEFICDGLPRHPLTQRKLPIERSGKVRVGDRLVRVNEVSLEAAPGVEAAMTLIYSHLVGQNASDYIVLEFESATLKAPTWICPICTYVNDFRASNDKMEGVGLNSTKLSCLKCKFNCTREE